MNYIGYIYTYTHITYMFILWCLPCSKFRLFLCIHMMYIYVNTQANTVGSNTRAC